MLRHKILRQFSKRSSQTPKVMKDRPESSQELKDKMRSTMGSNEQYSAMQDKRLRSVAKDMSLYAFVVVLAGFTTKKAVDYFVSPGASEISQQNFQKKMTMGKEYKGEGVYKSS